MGCIMFQYYFYLLMKLNRRECNIIEQTDCLTLCFIKGVPKWIVDRRPHGCGPARLAGHCPGHGQWLWSHVITEDVSAPKRRCHEGTFPNV